MAVKNEPRQTRVKIRIKERVDKNEAGGTIGSGEKFLFIILGALLGLGIGYLVAGKVINYLRPVGIGFQPDLNRAYVQEADEEKKTPVVTDIEFDLP